MTEPAQNPVDPAGEGLEATLKRIECLTREQSRQVGWFSDWTVLFRPIEAVTNEFLNSRIEEFSGIHEDLINVIRARREPLSLSSGITETSSIS